MGRMHAIFIYGNNCKDIHKSTTLATMTLLPTPAPRKVTVYSKPMCIYCTKAKKFLDEKNVPYDVVELDPFCDEYDAQKEELVGKTNQNSYPFIFVGEVFLGGYMDLLNAYNTNRLHELCGLEMDF